MNTNDLIRLDISGPDIISAIESAKNHKFIDNLRTRSPIVSFDSKVRGYLGEIAIKKWLTAHGINNFRSNRLNEYTCDIDLDIITNNKPVSCEIKTSKIPDSIKNLHSVINLCDIKIIKRTEDVMVDRDVYIQIYYNMLTQSHDEFLNSTYTESRVSSEAKADKIYSTYRYSDYLENTFFVAWDYKDHIESRIRALPPANRTYRISKRDFYTCKICDSYEPARLAGFIKNY